MVDAHMVQAMLRPFGIHPVIREVIANLIVSHATATPIAKPATRLPSLAAVARHLHRCSLRRRDLIGRGADDPAWNMLLSIFADQHDDVPISVSSACIDSGSAPTTALRQLTRLHERGLLVRVPDASDRRRALVRLTRDAFEQTRQHVEGFCVGHSPIAADAAPRVAPADRTETA